MKTIYNNNFINWKNLKLSTMAKPMVDMQRQHVTNTKNAGSSLANCDFVSAKNTSQDVTLEHTQL